MAEENFVLFRQYPLQAGQKIRIESGPRRGDWEVIGVDDRRMRLRCPVSHREVEWDRFCCFAEKVEGAEWPERHND